MNASPHVTTSIIVLTYRRPSALSVVLQGLAKQCDPTCEVLIADDGSPLAERDALQRRLPAFACGVRHVWHPDVGFTAARARNNAARLARGRRLIFLDGDCVPNAQFLQRHAALARPGQFVNGSRVLLSERLTTQVEASAIDLASAGWKQWLSWRLAGDANKIAHLLAWPGAPGRVERSFRWTGIRSCNLAVWREDFEAVNGFDETFSGWGHEDADLVLRLHHLGLARCNGFLATEVFHLWHRENSRTDALRNHQTVQDRVVSRQVRAIMGLQEAHGLDEVVVTVMDR